MGLFVRPDMRLFVLPDMSHVGLCHMNTDYLVLRHHNGGIVGRAVSMSTVVR